MRSTVPKNIIIGCAPRTGSTLLQVSLGKHPQAIMGSEWFNIRLQEISPDTYERKTTGIPCNLFKVFGHQYKEEGFDELIQSGILIHLYRKDREAQKASYEKAIETGRWMGHQPIGKYKWDRPDNFDEILDGASRFEDIADISISYEYLISSWKLTICHILNLAGWQLRELPMATQRMAAT